VHVSDVFNQIQIGIVSSEGLWGIVIDQRKIGYFSAEHLVREKHEIIDSSHAFSYPQCYQCGQTLANTVLSVKYLLNPN